MEIDNNFLVKRFHNKHTKKNMNVPNQCHDNITSYWLQISMSNPFFVCVGKRRQNLTKMITGVGFGEMGTGNNVIEEFAL